MAQQTTTMGSAAVAIGEPGFVVVLPGRAGTGQGIIITLADETPPPASSNKDNMFLVM